MGVLLLALFLSHAGPAGADSGVGARVAAYLTELTRLDSTNPPGNETRVAEYLRRVAREEGIPCELLGPDPARLNFIARLPGAGKRRPLLLMAHSDVVPADADQWTFPPFSSILQNGFIYGRGTQDDKGLLAAELAVLVELKRSGVRLPRDVILLAEADEELGSAGIQWLIANAWEKVRAEFALNEGGYIMDVPSGRRLYHVQTAEKIPTRAVLRARGSAGHASMPTRDNPVVALSRAVVNLTDADQPVELNTTTRRYLSLLTRAEEFRWLAPLLPRLNRKQTAVMAANEIRERDPELDAQLRTTVCPTILNAGQNINVIPNAAEAQLDIRRLPGETRAEVMARLRHMVRDNSIEIFDASGQEMPATAPSSLETSLYRAMERVFLKTSPNGLVLPYMQRGATDGAFLRAREMPVYGVPLFVREDREGRAHGNDERISVANLEAGAALLLEVVRTLDH